MDRAWFRDVNAFARETPWAHGVLAAYALWVGLVLLACLLAAGWFGARRRADAPRAVATAFLAGGGAVVSLLANQAIGPAIGRTRPCHALAHVEVLLSCAHDSSFPSDHAMVAGAFAAGLLLLNRRLGLVATLLALALAFARVYVGVHFPSDVAAGLAIGAIIDATIVLALRRPATALAAHLAETRLRLLIAALDARSNEAGAQIPGERERRTRRPFLRLLGRMLGGGVEGNERLTALTATLLLPLLAAEGVTLLRIGQLLSPHEFIGMLLIPPVALKLASTGYRTVCYYRGRSAYVLKGPPQILLRALVAPVLVTSTVAVLATGVPLLWLQQQRGTLVGLHKIAFIVWAAAFALHTLTYIWRLPRALVRDWQERLVGRGLRYGLVAATLALGVLFALATVPSTDHWRDQHLPHQLDLG